MTKTADFATPYDCGIAADGDGAGGWNLHWTTCGREDNWVPYAPVWTSPAGSTYANVRNKNGANLCIYIPVGYTGTWHIVKDDLPPVPTNYTGAIGCLAY